MFVLHVEMKVKPGLQQTLEDIYLASFNPAITRQEGFRGVHLLRPVEDGNDYRLSIAFENQTSQQKWVATEAQRKLWSQMENQCVNCSVKHYRTV
jgi:heme-degrading monooxygenase HmoA